MAPERRCWTCRWWEAAANPPELCQSETGSPVGYCHRWPPLHPQRVMPGQLNDSFQEWRQPTTADEDWCGEWAAREESPDATP